MTAEAFHLTLSQEYGISPDHLKISFFRDGKAKRIDKMYFNDTLKEINTL